MATNAAMPAAVRALLKDPKFIVARGERYMRTLCWMVNQMPGPQRVAFGEGMLKALNEWLDGPPAPKPGRASSTKRAQQKRGGR